MREIETDLITEEVSKLCIKANLYLSGDVRGRIVDSETTERSALGRQVIGQLIENMEIAETSQIPICQDTGMAVFFVEVGQELHVKGSLTEAINEGVRKGYKEGYLRKSVVSDPILRVNTGDNTPAIIMSRLFMLKPADGVEGIKEAVLTTVKEAGPNACPPFTVGVGVGGDFELSAILAKKALTRSLDVRSDLPHIKALEDELLKEINELGIGPAGLGGSTTALAVNIETYPTHIAGMPVAVNMCCHVNRHARVIL